MPIFSNFAFFDSPFCLHIAHCFWVPILLKILLANLVKAYSKPVAMYTE